MQISKSKQTKSKISPKTIVLTAMFAALVTAATAFIKIPAPLGYAHAGDSMVFLAACALPGPFGLIAAAIGGAMADLLSGYAVWVIPTAVIKALNVLPFLLAKRFVKKHSDRLIHPASLIAVVPTTVITIGGYFIANLLLYDYAAAIAETPFNLVQSAVGAVLFVAIGLALDAVGFKQRLLK